MIANQTVNLLGKQLVMNFRKELWEFKKTIMLTPILLAGLILALAIFQLSTLHGYQSENWSAVFKVINDQGAPAGLDIAVQVFFGALFLFFMVICLVIQLYYCLSCLYDERRDMSVYFWRSLPVSDIQTVMVKLFTATFLIPIVFMATATALICVFLFVLFVLSSVLSLGFDTSIWSVWANSGIIDSLTLLWLSLPLYSLWLFPVFAWLMLASAFAKKAPFLWATLPIAIVLLAEVIMVVAFDVGEIYFSELVISYFSIIPDINDVKMMSGVNGADFIDPEQQPLAYFSKILGNKITFAGTVLACLMMSLSYWLRKHRAQA